MIDENNAIQQLQSGMLNKALFVMSRTFPRPEDLPKHIPEHLEWMISMEKDGYIFAAGPFVDRHGKLAGGSMIIFRAKSSRFPTNYTVWFHIVANDSDDQYMIYDYEPMAQTTDWPRQDLFLFSPQIKLIPGSYDISFGFWTPGNRRRLTVDDSDEYWINLGTFEVPEPEQIP